jgi:hypothetical protein
LAIIIGEEKQVNKVIDKLKDAGLHIIIPMLDYRYPGLSQKDKYEILQSKWLPELVENGMSTGHFTFNNGRLQVIIQQPAPVIAGFIYEAYVVKKAKNDKVFFSNLFKWSTGRSKVKEDFLQQYIPIGLGHKTTREKYSDFFEPTYRKFDIIFIRYNPTIEKYEEATVIQTTRRAGVQIKAIKGNEKVEIIVPILEGTYEKVITMLKHRDNIHSYEYCLDIANKMHNHNEISYEQKKLLESSIVCPRQMGIDQYEIDAYYDFIYAWYNKEVEADKTILKGVSLSLQTALLNQSILT